MNPSHMGEIRAALQSSHSSEDDRFNSSGGAGQAQPQPHYSGGYQYIHDIESYDDELENLARYGSVNSSALDVTRHRTQSAGGMSEDKNFVIIDRMRRRLKFYFMNPLEKWQTKRQFPYKLSVQVIKVFFVTIQLVLFASYRYANVNYTNDNKVTFSHLFLKEWDSSREISTYPPPVGPLAVYTKSEFYDYVDFAVNAYSDVQNISIGPYFYDNHNGSISPMQFCVERYAMGIIFGFNESYAFDSAITTQCLNISVDALGSSKGSFSIRDYLADHNFTMSFEATILVQLKFSLKTIRFRDIGPLKSPDCFRFDIIVEFNNQDHDGQTLVSLEATPVRLTCSGRVEDLHDSKLERIGRSAVNYVVISTCALSLVLCCRAIYRAQLLKAEAIQFFKKFYKQELSVNERLEFLNFWYVLIIFNDTFIIIGSILKEQIENKELTGDTWNICSLLLGVGNLLVWFGVLRYLGFFRTYNVLILTLKRATPNVLRFLLCALLIYAGFTFCGWLILGPYHMKFSTLSMTSECLFALINGDDMFATFAGMSSKSNLLWWFCRIYLYTFISLFIYVVLSLFIALIMDAYDTIKLYYTEGFPRSLLEDFIQAPEPVNMNSSVYGSTTTAGVQNIDNMLTRRASVAGVLDTIVERICGCSTPHSSAATNCRSARPSVDEHQPLLRT